MPGAVTESSTPVHRFILLTDIAGSSRLAEAYPQEYIQALEQHNRLIEQAVADFGGIVYKHTGDGCLAFFESAGGSVDCAVELAQSLAGIAPLAEGEPLLTRIVLHVGELQPSGAEYFGPALNRASRICQVCNPGQVLLSAAVATVLGRPREELQLIGLGRHHLRDLAEPEQLYQLVHPGFTRHEFPPLATLNNRPNNLVRQPNAFIGRTRELDELAELLRGETSLVSIIAPGGYGKSRLAAQLCANLLHRFERGCFVVYLAPVREETEVPFAIGNALGYQFSAGRTPEQQLCDYLRNKELLLCLDNFEHLLGCGPLAADILQAAPQVKVVITSREPLRIKGEQTYILEPLQLEAGAGEFSESELLFADRAMLVNRNFSLTPENSPAVRHFCQHMSGIPLAIELAAAWMDSFTLAELHDELTNQLELESRTSDQEPRHQSLKASLDWSWNLLGAQQQETLMRLSTFRGGFFSEAAAAVLNMKGMALRAALSRLCDKSWLYTRAVDNQTRFFMRDMLAHEYAFARLEETRGAGDSLFEQAVGAHAAYFAQLVGLEGPRLNGGGTPDGGAAQRQALRTWQLELENISAALDSALSRNEIGWLRPIAEHLQRYLDLTSASFIQCERYRLLHEAAQSLGDPDLQVTACLGLGRALWRLSQPAEAMGLHKAAEEIAAQSGNRLGTAICLAALANIHNSQGEFTLAAELFHQALPIFREFGERYGEAGALNNLGIAYGRQGDNENATKCFRQTLAIYREIGNRNGETHSIINLGVGHYTQGDFAGALELYSQALSVFRESDDRNGEALVLYNQGIIRKLQGDLSRTVELFSEALAIQREIGDRQGEADILNGLGVVHMDQGDIARAEELYNRSVAICREAGFKSRQATALSNLGNLQVMRGDYSGAEELYKQALAIQLESNDRWGAAYTWFGLGRVQHTLGNFAAAAGHYRQALAIRREINAKADLTNTCAVAGTCLEELGAWRSAALAIHGAIACAAANDHQFEPDDQQLLDSARDRLAAAVDSGDISAEQLAAWKAEGEALGLDALADFILGELGNLQDSSQVSG